MRLPQGYLLRAGNPNSLWYPWGVDTRPRRRLGSGFVEVAIAILFLALAMVPLLDSILSGSRRARQDRNRVFATALCASAIERYRLEVPSNVAGAMGSVDTDAALNPPDALGDWATWRSKYNVVPSYADAGDGTGVLSVEVTWMEGSHTRSVKMETVLARTYAPGAS